MFKMLNLGSVWTFKNFSFKTSVKKWCQQDGRVGSPRPSSCHKHTNSATIHGKISFVRNPEAIWRVPGSQVNVKPDSQKPVGRVPSQVQRQSGRDSLSPSFTQRKKGVGSHVQHPHISQQTPHRTGFCLATVGALIDPAVEPPGVAGAGRCHRLSLLLSKEWADEKKSQLSASHWGGKECI